VTTSSFNSDYQYGDVVSGSYPLSASISTDFYLQNRLSGSNRKVNALKNSLRSYLVLSPQFSYVSELPNATWNKSTQTFAEILHDRDSYGRTPGQ
jgi:hypothetical protein